MILIGLGSNVEGPWGSPRETVTRALRELDSNGTRLVIASRLVETTPFGKVNQPSFVKGTTPVKSQNTVAAGLVYTFDMKELH